MNISANAARLTVQLREPAAEGYELAARVVQRAHAAGMWSATIRRGSGSRARAAAIPEPRTDATQVPVARSVSLIEEEGFTVVIAGREEDFADLVRQLRDVIGDTAIVRIESRGELKEFSVHHGPARSR